MASPQTRNLKTANGGKVAPQHYNDAMGDFEYSKGSDGALHTKVINQPSVTLVDKNGNPLDSGNKLPVDVTFPAEQAVKDTDVLAKLADIETKIQATNDRLNQTLNTQLTGSNVALDVNVVNTNNDWKLQEQLTQADAVNGTLTFSDVVKAVDIFNQDPTNSGVFTINGLSITVPANTFFCAEIGGNLSNTVTVSGTTSYIIGRYA